MPVCLHCGEIAPDGALFCGNCGYTLPQPGDAVAGAHAASPASQQAPLRASAPAPPYPPRGAPAYPSQGAHAPTAAYATAGSLGSAGTGSIPPPPNAKYCVRCATLIARAAVFCPVCQQPQP